MGLRWDVSDAARLAQLLDHPPVTRFHISGGAALVRSYRDVYCDTADGDLRQRGARYRVRFTADGKRHLTVWLPDGGGTRVTGAEAETRVRAVVDPARLMPWIELDVARRWRVIGAPLVRLPLSDLIGDTFTARRAEVQATFWELGLEPRGWPGAGLAARALGRRLEATLQLRRVGDDPVQRAHAALDDAEGQLVARELRGERELALVAVEHGRLGLCRLGAELRIPVDKGSGESACRDALRRLVGNGEGQLRLLGVVPAAGERPAVEVSTVRRVHPNSVLQWFSPTELLERVGSPLLRDRATLAALTLAARSPLVPEWSGMAFGDGTGADESAPAPESVERQSRVTLSELRTPVLTAEQADPARAQPEQFLNPELSWLEFNARVLALAEDARTPPAARVRFLGIFSTNLDDFVAAKVAALRHLVARAGSSPSGDGLRPQQTLDALAIRLRPLITRQYRLFDALVRTQGSDAQLSVSYWAELTAAEQADLRTRFTDTVLPFLSPKALTRAPGHPFPVIGERRVVLLVVLRDRAGAPPHYGLVEIPETLPRFDYLPDGRRLLPIEELVRANLDLLYPGRLIMAAHAFRVTRGGELQLDESAAANFLQAIEDELVRRVGPIVRIEIEPATPEPLRNLLQRELHFEETEREGGLDAPDVYIAGGPVDLGALRDLPTRLGDYPPFAARDAFAPNRPVAEQVDEHDVLVHHPHDSFTSSFERFIVEAADDPEVQSIKLTLYRPGSGASALADALRRAAAGGKDVAVIVELKARFDEARNIAWARSLERDGIHVVTGLVSLKTHAKLALVVARKSGGGSARRYAHIGTGNYNPDTARIYTDVGLFTADPRITADVHSLFNDLTGSTQPPQGGLPHLLVSPADLLDRVLALIDRETKRALAGRPARIRAKINGLADSTITQALYRASQAGVDVDLSVRGICTLRPGVPGLSERIRVTSVLGRFLEHARIYHFANGGEGEEYYIGSADWRPRNLRRRVEVVAPVFDPAVRGKLDAILTGELEGSGRGQDDKRRWILTSDGRYEPA